MKRTEDAGTSGAMSPTGTNYRTGHVGRARQPWYGRILGLKNIRLSRSWSVVFFEGSAAVAVLLALTELVSWWVVPVLPLLVAGLVKLNDIIAGAGKY
ncbi:hypothetical protein [Salininema proteolyticum]|uniref:Uncharacterized protein n=1 Tax=Salininema proteolyticum TaxID=1607685 RepID=A0ABV8TUW7_9ACTN